MTHHVFHVPARTPRRNWCALWPRAPVGESCSCAPNIRPASSPQLTEWGIPSVDLHGNLSQPARDRNLAAFTAGTARVLVATDIAARGVHVDDVELVVHCDPPAEHKAYLHRSGRTARAGRAGDVVTVVLPEQRKDTAVLLRKAGIKAVGQPVAADSAAVLELVGELAPHQAPTATPTAAQPPRRTAGRISNAAGRRWPPSPVRRSRVRPTGAGLLASRVRRRASSPAAGRTPSGPPGLLLVGWSTKRFRPGRRA